MPTEYYQGDQNKPDALTEYYVRGEQLRQQSEALQYRKNVEHDAHVRALETIAARDKGRELPPDAVKGILSVDSTSEDIAKYYARLASIDAGVASKLYGQGATARQAWATHQASMLDAAGQRLAIQQSGSDMPLPADGAPSQDRSTFENSLRVRTSLHNDATGSPSKSGAKRVMTVPEMQQYADQVAPGMTVPTQDTDMAMFKSMAQGFQRRTEAAARAGKTKGAWAPYANTTALTEANRKDIANTAYQKSMEELGRVPPKDAPFEAYDKGPAKGMTPSEVAEQIRRAADYATELQVTGGLSRDVALKKAISEVAVPGTTTEKRGFPHWDSVDTRVPNKVPTVVAPPPTAGNASAPSAPGAAPDPMAQARQMIRDAQKAKTPIEAWKLMKATGVTKAQLEQLLAEENN